MKILDSSVVIALFKSDDIHHKKAKEIFFDVDDFIIPNYILVEVLSILKMKCGSEAVKKCLQFLYNSEDVDIHEIHPETFDEAVMHFITYHNNLSFADVLLLILSQRTKISLVTFDKELEKISTKKYRRSRASLAKL